MHFLIYLSEKIAIFCVIWHIFMSAVIILYPIQENCCWTCIFSMSSSKNKATLGKIRRATVVPTKTTSATSQGTSRYQNMSMRHPYVNNLDKLCLFYCNYVKILTNVCQISIFMSNFTNLCQNSSDPYVTQSLSLCQNYFKKPTWFIYYE